MCLLLLYVLFSPNEPSGHKVGESNQVLIRSDKGAEGLAVYQTKNVIWLWSVVSKLFPSSFVVDAWENITLPVRPLSPKSFIIKPKYCKCFVQIPTTSTSSIQTIVIIIVSVVVIVSAGACWYLFTLSLSTIEI